MKFYVNGRFLTRKMTGVERYATELLTALDTLLDDGGAGAAEWTILAPEGLAPDVPRFRNIAIRTGGRGGGHLWEQASLPRLARDGVLVNLANSGPLAHRRSFTVIHDAIVYRMPQLFSFRYRTLHQGLGFALSRLSRLGTVSEFSRGELARVFKLDPGRIAVLPNGSEHLGQVPPDETVLERLRVRTDGFLLFVGSPAPHKNLARALAAYASLGQTDRAFVIVGSSQTNVFGRAAEPLPPGAIAAGRLTDPEVAALYRHATALVFPSLYEGFGIPPLEAISYGCPVAAAAIPPVREVCGEAVDYFDPRSHESIAEALGRVLAHGRAGNPRADAARARLDAFSWRVSAFRLKEAVERIAA